MRRRTVAIALLAATGLPAAAPSDHTNEVESIIRKLDITSFANSIGRRHIAGKTTFADYGFVVVEKTANWAKLVRKDDGRIKSFAILSSDPKYLKICFRDRFVMTSDSNSPIRADISAALAVRKTKHGPWTAEQVRGGFLNCRNTLPER